MVPTKPVRGKTIQPAMEKIWKWFQDLFRCLVEIRTYFFLFTRRHQIVIAKRYFIFKIFNKSYSYIVRLITIFIRKTHIFLIWFYFFLPILKIHWIRNPPTIQIRLTHCWGKTPKRHLELNSLNNCLNPRLLWILRRQCR